MARVRYLGPHPEPSVSLPNMGDGPLRAWPLRGQSIRNEAWAFPREMWRTVPPLVACWLAAVRRREGPWFEVRLERGEWAQLCQRVGLGAGQVSTTLERAADEPDWGEDEEWTPMPAPVLKISAFTRWTSPRAVEGFLTGYRGRYTVANEQHREALRHDGATGQTTRPAIPWPKRLR